jgi:hypothetical protein
MITPRASELCVCLYFTLKFNATTAFSLTPLSLSLERLRFPSISSSYADKVRKKTDAYLALLSWKCNFYADYFPFIFTGRRPSSYREISQQHRKALAITRKRWRRFVFLHDANNFTEDHQVAEKKTEWHSRKNANIKSSFTRTP